MQKPEIERKAREGAVLSIPEVMFWIHGVKCSMQVAPYVLSSERDREFLEGSIIVRGKTVTVVTRHGTEADCISVPNSEINHEVRFGPSNKTYNCDPGSRLTVRNVESVQERFRAYVSLYGNGQRTVTTECIHVIGQGDPSGRELYRQKDSLNEGLHPVQAATSYWNISCPEALQVYADIDIDPPRQKDPASLMIRELI